MRLGSALVAVLVIACGTADGGAPDELRFWAFGREGEVVTELVRDFEREHQGIRVRVQQIPWSAAHEKLVTAHVGNATPDIAQLGNTWIAEFAALNAIEPLDSFLAASAVVDSGAFFPGIWATNVLEAQVYGIPWYVDTRVIFYRTDLLARAGYQSPPGTWQEWRVAMEAVKRQDPESFAIFLPTNEWAQPVILGLQAGSPLLRDGGRYGAFADSAFRRAFEFYVGLFRDGLAPAAGNADIANPYQEFARGHFAMYITGPWNLGEFRRRLPAEMQSRWGTAPLPGPAGPASGVSLAGGSSLVIFRSSRHKQDAWRLIEFLTRPEQQARFYHLSGDLPARTAAWRDSALANDGAAAAFWAQLQRVVPMPQVPEWELIATKVLEHAETVIRGGRPVGAALADLDRDADRILEKRRWMLDRNAAARVETRGP